MAVSPARTAAYDVLLRVERDGAYASELLNSPLCESLSNADRALTMTIVMGVLRWRSSVDAAVGAFSRMPLRKLDTEVLTALRVGAYQLLYLERIPARAAIHESVELVKRARKASAAPMTNALLRKIAEGKRPDSTGRTEPDESVEKIVERYDHPAWLVDRWAAEYGLEAAARIAEFDQQVPPVGVRLRGDAETAERELREAGVELAPGALLRRERIVTKGDVVGTAAFREGRLAIQDEGSQLVALLVGRGERILDCCAAPGGKTALIADRNQQAKIVAAEIHEHRARTMRKLVRNSNVEVVHADATALPFEGSFDRVLADVPCSGTGTLARNPEIKWRLRPDDLVDLRARQVAILEAALGRVSPGGRLVYSSCSLEREENESVVEEVLGQRGGFRVVDTRDVLATMEDELAMAPAMLVRGPFLRTIPGVHACDGFFAAVLERD